MRDSPDVPDWDDEIPEYDIPDDAPVPEEGIVPLGHDHGTFYYLSRAARQVFALSAQQHVKSHFLAMASLPHYWSRTQFAGEKGKIDWDGVADHLMRSCRDVGIYDPERVRGRGAWFDDGRAVLHLGDRLIVDGVPVPSLTLSGSRHVYEAGLPMLRDIPAPLSNAEAHKLVKICASLNWERAIHGTLLAGFLATAPICGGLAWRPSIWLTGKSGSGKAQPHSAKVLTPTGWSTIGELRPGSLVSTPDGSYGRVMQVYPQGVRPIFKLTFADGRTARATGDHLWKVRERGQWRLRTTEQMIDTLRHDKTNARYLAIPLPAPLTIKGNNNFDLPLHPYALGVLLGDGHLANQEGSEKSGTIRITSSDPEIFARVQSVLPSGLALFYTNNNIEMRLGGLDRYSRQARQMIKDIRLLGTRSHNKFVPPEYLFASINDRIELLKGLMDTDGTVNKQGTVSFCTVSKQLAEDVQYLVRSLGGIAAIKTKSTVYTHNGQRHTGRMAYQVNIRLPDPTIAFSLPRKLARVSKSYQYADSFYLGVNSIEIDGEEEASCIAIDHPDRLYVTDDFVVTHNTWVYENIIAACLRGYALFVQSKTSEAGIRQRLGSDARPVAFDEAEAEDTSSQQRLQAVLDLIRQSASETGGEIVKGTPNQAGARSYRIRSSFALVSINVSLQHAADESRITVLTLRPNDGTHAAAERFASLNAEVQSTLTPAFAAALIARSARLLPVIRENAETFAHAVALRLGSRRAGDQIGALLAGAYSLHSDGRITPEQAADYVARQSWDATTAETEPDELRLLAHLTQHRLRVTWGNGGTTEATVGTLIEAALGRDERIPADVAERTLRETGMRTDPGGLFISNTHPALAAILRGTPWHAQWGRTLQRLPGAERTGRTVRFGPLHSSQRAVFVPFSALDGDA